MWFFRKPKERKVGVFVDVGTFVNGEDNRYRRMDWKRAIKTVESIIDFGKDHLFLAFPNISSPYEMEAYKRLEYLGAKLGSNSAIKNDSDLCLAHEVQQFVEGNDGNVDLVLLAGDRDYVKTIETLAGKYARCKLHVFCTGRSTSKLLEDLAKGMGGKVYKDLDVFYEGIDHREAWRGDAKGNSDDKERGGAPKTSAVPAASANAVASVVSAASSAIGASGGGLAPIGELLGISAPVSDVFRNDSPLVFLILQSIAQAEEKGRYAFFQKTAELVSFSHNVEIQPVKDILSKLISEGYLTQENRTSSKNNPIRTIEFTPAGRKLFQDCAAQ